MDKKNNSLENIMWSAMGKQTAQAKKVYNFGSFTKKKKECGKEIQEPPLWFTQSWLKNSNRLKSKSKQRNSTDVVSIF